jgi:inner membrane protein
MPSPIGHSLLGYALCLVFRPTSIRSLKMIGLCLFAANAADLDFIPGLLIGHPEQFHHGISHSIGMAALFALVCACLRFLGPSFRTNFTALFSIYFSHVVLDYFSIDTTPPYGVPLWWPLTHDYFIAPFAFFPDIRRSPLQSEFFMSLFSWHNLWSITVELMVIGPILLIIRILQKPSPVMLVPLPQPRSAGRSGSEPVNE